MQLLSGSKNVLACVHPHLPFKWCSRCRSLRRTHISLTVAYCIGSQVHRLCCLPVNRPRHRGVCCGCTVWCCLEPMSSLATAYLRI